MRFDVSKWTRLAALGIVTASFVSTGCSSSSGWKMPGAKMFSWSKKPSESTLAGAGPSAIKYPDSPASKQKPQAVASAAAGSTGAKTSLAGTGLPGSGATQTPGALAGRSTSPTYTPPNGMSNVAFAPPAAAAAANGYSVGPYNTYSQPGAAANALAAAGAPSGAPAAGMSPSNPYYNPSMQAGLPSTQMYAASNPSMQGINKANPAAAPSFPQQTANAGYQATPPGMGGMNSASGMPASFAAASSNPNPGFAPGAPVTTGTPGFSLPQSMPSTAGGYSPVGTSNGSGSSFASSPSGTLPTSGLPATNSAPAMGASSVPAQMATYNAQNAGTGMSTASFRPGSTGRQTNYNFAQPATGTAVAGQGLSAPGSTQAPSTATGTNNPGFQVPPATTYR